MDYNLNKNEEEECRLCLEIGIIRRCCNQYYCQPCYYKSNKCPGCNSFASLTSIGKSNSALLEKDPKRFFVGASWIITLGISIIIGSLFVLIAVNEFTFPKTYFGLTCHGFFPLCNLKICIEMTETSLSQDMPLEYKECNFETSFYSIIGDACVFDQDLFQQSNGALGCVSINL